MKSYRLRWKWKRKTLTANAMVVTKWGRKKIAGLKSQELDKYVTCTPLKVPK